MLVKRLIPYIVITIPFAGRILFSGKKNCIPDQEFLFEAGSTNLAKGFLCCGIYIDNNGNLFGFRRDGSLPFYVSALRSAAELSVARQLTSEIVRKEVGFSKTLLTVGGKDVHCRNYQHLSAAKSQIPSKPKHIGADMSTHFHVGYEYDSWNRAYEQTILKKRGGVTIENRSHSAEILVDWLDSLLDEYFDPWVRNAANVSP